ncbi:MAG: transposase [Campylobacterales bacterium]|nr:transposase [Campylobacterales bacterium]
MARKPRLDCIGYYHVINRGVERCAIFLDNNDRGFFMELIDELRDLFVFRIHAFCLMDNHYHLWLYRHF